MLLEPILVKALGGASGALGTRLFNSAMRLKDSARKADIAAATYLQENEVILALDRDQIRTLCPGKVSYLEMEIFFGRPDCQALTHELLAAVLARHLDITERIHDGFDAIVGREFPQLSHTETKKLSSFIFDALNDSSISIRKRIEAKHPETAKRIQEGAQRTLILRTLENISRHLEILLTKPQYSKRDEELFLKNYRKQLLAAHGNINPPDFDRRKKVPIKDLYVSPQIRDYYPGTGSGEREFDLDSFSIQIDRSVLLGDPGGGKSTAAAVITSSSATDSLQPVPFLIVLREFPYEPRDRISVVDHIESRVSNYYQLAPPRGLIERLLADGSALVIFDGLDELVDTSKRREMTDIVELFCNRYPLSRVLVTSRKVGYEQAPMDELVFDAFLISGFSHDQVADYTNKWFKQEALPEGERAAIVDAFIRESASVPDLIRNPLMLALMCIIYRGQGFIPRNRPEVYERCATMLFDKWDSSRKIYVDLRAAQHIDAAMKHLAFWMLSGEHAKDGVTETALIRETSTYLQARAFEREDDALLAAEEFVKFCRNRAWVFTDSGSTADGELLYKFTHRTFMEYFAAFHLVRIADTPEVLAKKLLPRIAKKEWDVVGQLAIQISNRNSDRGADRVLNAFLKDRRRRSAASKRAILEFCARCLEFIVPRPQVIRGLVRLITEFIIDNSSERNGSNFELLRALVDCAPEVSITAADEVTNVLGSYLGRPGHPNRSSVFEFAVVLDLFQRSIPATGYDDRPHSAWRDAKTAFIDAHFDEFYSIALSNIAIALRCVHDGTMVVGDFVNRTRFDTDAMGIGKLFIDAPSSLFPTLTYTGLASQLVGAELLKGGDASSRFGRRLSSLEELSRMMLDLGAPPWRLFKRRAKFRAVFGREVPDVHSIDPTISGEAWFSTVVIYCILFELRSIRLERRADTIREGPIAEVIRHRADNSAGSDLTSLNSLGIDSAPARLIEEWARGQLSFVRS